MTRMQRLHVPAKPNPHSEESLVAVVIKARTNNATVLTLIYDGDFADHTNGDRSETVHAGCGKGPDS